MVWREWVDGWCGGRGLMGGVDGGGFMGGVEGGG